MGVFAVTLFWVWSMCIAAAKSEKVNDSYQSKDESVRIETGALQIDNDCTGLFIRGDDVLYLRDILSMMYSNIDGLQQPFVYKLIRAIDVDVCHRSKNRDVQIVKTKLQGN